MDLTNICIFRIEFENTLFTLTGTVKDGQLILSGYDIGDLPMQFFHDEDYEYWYTFDVENTNKLAEALGPGDILANVYRFFGKKRDLPRFEKFCEEHGIKYKWSSY